MERYRFKLDGKMNYMEREVLGREILEREIGLWDQRGERWRKIGERRETYVREMLRKREILKRKILDIL